MLIARIAIAIVDDEESLRVSLRRLCCAFGLEAYAFASGPEFIAWLDEGHPRPDCLLLDAHMPDMTGLEVQQHLVARGETFPTVVYTGDDAPEAHARFMAAGAVAFLRKPAGADELLAAIERAVAIARAKRTAQHVSLPKTDEQSPHVNQPSNGLAHAGELAAVNSKE